jgi:hypothetical protein
MILLDSGGQIGVEIIFNGFLNEVGSWYSCNCGDGGGF